MPQLRPSTVQRDKITRQLAGLGDVGFSFASPGSLDIVEAVAQALPPPAATTGAAAGGSAGRVRCIQKAMCSQSDAPTLSLHPRLDGLESHTEVLHN